jgi:hypothetical protein
MSDETLDAKFRALAGETLSPAQVEELLRCVRELDRAPHLRHLTRLLQAD